MIEMDAVPIIPQHVMWEQEAGGGALLYNMDTDEMLALNRVGATILRLCDGQRPTREIIQNLLGKFRVSEETCRQETANLLNQLTVKGLLEWQS